MIAPVYFVLCGSADLSVLGLFRPQLSTSKAMTRNQEHMLSSSVGKRRGSRSNSGNSMRGDGDRKFNYLNSKDALAASSENAANSNWPPLGGGRSRSRERAVSRRQQRATSLDDKMPPPIKTTASANQNSHGAKVSSRDSNTSLERRLVNSYPMNNSNSHRSRSRSPSKLIFRPYF